MNSKERKSEGSRYTTRVCATDLVCRASPNVDAEHRLHG